MQKNFQASTCCFTGHRPEKLQRSESTIRAALQNEIELAFNHSYTIFLTGMSRGVDLWAAELVLEYRSIHPIKLFCAIPFCGFEKIGTTNGNRNTIEYYRKQTGIVISLPLFPMLPITSEIVGW